VLKNKNLISFKVISRSSKLLSFISLHKHYKRHEATTFYTAAFRVLPNLYIIINQITSLKSNSGRVQLILFVPKNIISNNCKNPKLLFFFFLSFSPQPNRYKKKKKKKKKKIVDLMTKPPFFWFWFNNN